MAGLLGRTFADDPGAVGMGGGGLLGPMTGAQKAAMLFAGLRDAVGNFSGRPTENLNMLADQYGRQNQFNMVRQDRLQDRQREDQRYEQGRKDKMVRPATPEEKAAANMDPNTPALVDAFGKIDPITDPNKITAYQQAMLKNAEQRSKLDWAQFGETVRNNNFSNSLSALNAGEAAKMRELAMAKAQQEFRDKDMTRNSQAASYDTAINTLDRLKSHPGFKAAVGFGAEKAIRGVLPFVETEGVTPGTKRADFMAELDAFKAQSFLPMVAQLKGMGALSDAEGKKLSDAVGALNANMSEEAFVSSVNRIKGELNAARMRVGGKPRAAAPQQGQPGQLSPQEQAELDALRARFKGR